MFFGEESFLPFVTEGFAISNIPLTSGIAFPLAMPLEVSECHTSISQVGGGAAAP